MIKAKAASKAPLPPAASRSSRTPRFAAVRKLDPERPQRVWSLLLPPSFERK